MLLDTNPLLPSFRKSVYINAIEVASIMNLKQYYIPQILKNAISFINPRLPLIQKNLPTNVLLYPELKNVTKENKKNTIELFEKALDNINGKIKNGKGVSVIIPKKIIYLNADSMKYRTCVALAVFGNTNDVMYICKELPVYENAVAVDATNLCNEVFINYLYGTLAVTTVPSGITNLLII